MRRVQERTVSVLDMIEGSKLNSSQFSLPSELGMPVTLRNVDQGRHIDWKMLDSTDKFQKEDSSRCSKICKAIFKNETIAVGKVDSEHAILMPNEEHPMLMCS